MVVLKNTPLTIESLWLSSRASERGIQRSEVRFLLGPIIFSLSHEKYLSLWVHQFQGFFEIILMTDGLLAKLVERCTSITEVMGSNSVWA